MRTSVPDLSSLTLSQEFSAAAKRAAAERKRTTLRFMAGLSQNRIQFAPELGGHSRRLSARRDRHLHVSSINAGGHDKGAFPGGIGDVGEDAAALGGDSDPVIPLPVVGRGEDQDDAGEVGRAE